MEIVNNVVLHNWSDLADHLYCLVLDTKELYPKTKELIRRTWVVNIYNSSNRQKYT